MSDSKQPSVLDVGQCDLDHGNIGRLLSNEFGAAVERAQTIDEAIQTAANRHFDLILVNRVFAANGEEGVAFIQRLRGAQHDDAPPVMLVSNYDDAQDAACAAGAVRGFGKNALSALSTIELLSAHLRR